jgi:molecular chaperone GrpE
LSKKKHEIEHEVESDVELEAAPDKDAAEPTPEAEPEAAVAPEPTVEEQLQAEVLRLQDELAEQKDRLLRTVAEMDNLRKRTRREVLESRRFAQADLLRPLLEILDNFDRALDHAPAVSDEDHQAAFHEGVAMIAQSFRQVLLDRGVQPIAAEGELFDPARHEAVGQQPAPEGVDSGTILAEVQTGYTLDDLVLRASRVIVAQ